MILFVTSLAAVQEKQSQRRSFLGSPMSILDLYQHSLYGHFGEDGPEQLAHYSLIEQLSGASSKDSKTKESSSVSYCNFYIISLFAHYYFYFPFVFFPQRVDWLLKPGRLGKHMTCRRVKIWIFLEQNVTFECSPVTELDLQNWQVETGWCLYSTISEELKFKASKYRIYLLRLLLHT